MEEKDNTQVESSVEDTTLDDLSKFVEDLDRWLGQMKVNQASEWEENMRIEDDG